MGMSSNYNTRPRAAEVMVDGEAVHLIRRREDIAAPVRARIDPALTPNPPALVCARPALTACGKKAEEKKSGATARADHRHAGHQRRLRSRAGHPRHPRSAGRPEDRRRSRRHGWRRFWPCRQGGQARRTAGHHRRRRCPLQNQADQAEARRLEVLARQQDKLVERQQSLVDKGFLSKNAADDAEAQRAAIADQFTPPRRAPTTASVRSARPPSLAPFDGIIEIQMVSPGDYVKVGDPLFQLVSQPAARPPALPRKRRAAPDARPGGAADFAASAGQGVRQPNRDIRPGIVRRPAARST